MVTPVTSEIGVIKTFRRFTGVRLIFLVFSVVIYFLEVGRATLSNWPFFALMLLDTGLLLVYLSVPRLEEVLKRAYLPVGIIWSTLLPIVELHFIFSMFSIDAPVRSIFLFAFQLVLVLFIPMIMIAWCYSKRSVILFSVITLFVDVGLFFFTYSTSAGIAFISPILGISFIRTVTFLLIGNMVANLVKVQREQNMRLAEAYDKLAAYASTQEKLAISRERNRMARELHDVLAHTMSGVAIELEGVRSVLRVDCDRAEELLSQSLSAIREGLNETRRALQSLRASPIEDLGLGLAIRNLIELNADRSSLETDLRIEGNLPDYPDEVQQCFYRVAQESLTNVIVHSKASKLEVNLWREGALLKLSIRDNGIGFDQDKEKLDDKYGLMGMRERAAIINGELSIVSQVGRGTEILLTYESDSQGDLND
ncbi:MAG: sensor histidine kinase [Chloroflexi bacterium]|nr:sensor histidine kinase [Chloroflexota bacterium]